MYVFAHVCEDQTLELDVLLGCFESLQLTELVSLSSPRDLVFAVPVLIAGITALDVPGFLCGMLKI